MFRNQYDGDATTWSPQGRLHQVEYALEAIKQGSAAVGVVSNTHTVLVALKRNAEELSSYQKKIVRIDDHVGVAIAGLAPDARVLSNFMRQQALASKMTFNRPIPIKRLVNMIAERAQLNTQEYGKRPYGVGMLVGGCDETGPHLYEFLPSGMVLEYLGTSMGARSQSARTYLERNLQSFPAATREELVLYALRALRDTLPQDHELTRQNVSICVVGKDEKFVLYDDDEETVQWLEKLGDTSPAAARSTAAAAAAAATATAAATSQEQQPEQATEESNPDAMDTN
ncbi:20S proteasome component alpha 6 subunit Pre5 [Schizosaccharomyces japonicus yFS275]|uniref:Proteasome subunit alpha type n=1 Tax=Schizosaccharomyces japonicus (strain yFS275 / FY16936) TaxID=402676 RepID=B6K6M1_SCHJY|nr:20S proteasome component alpha 6 subunit Pre5 [Schizosaccharomyces japonicus yFS275]EEB09175.1 20S proteasome component alpha 6 subunit Pre5 [Schizosaccharomyces japonicus yFS275]